MSFLRVTGVHTAAKILQGVLVFRLAACVILFPHPVEKMGRCQYQQCGKFASYNIEGCTRGAYCKQHAKDGMVVVRCRRCLHDSCTKQPSFNVEGLSLIHI